jgi:hypothetical protein
MTDYLRFIFHTFDLYAPVIPILKIAVEKTGTQQFVDLCSGSGGAVEKILEYLSAKHKLNVNFILTDKYPPLKTYQYLAKKTKGAVSFIPIPVLAEQVPQKLKGFRTMFSGIHHFEPDGVKAVFRNATDAGEGIVVFDGGDRNIWMMLLIIIFHPVALVLFTPFIKPFRWSRIFFTYLIPLIPIGAIWDGLVSIHNLYKPSELLALTENSVKHPYYWGTGKVRNKFGLSIVYLLGIPEEKNTSRSQHQCVKV